MTRIKKMPENRLSHSEQASGYYTNFLAPQSAFSNFKVAEVKRRKRRGIKPNFEINASARTFKNSF